uniref:SnoaL-like domain-containing protein n=1 Tax=OCS116 cluster bacterium TaxID=2030921 RepID=A0A2A4YU66_9PROT
MKHSRLIDHYNYAFDTMQFDEMYDLMTEDFYFRNPSLEITGRDNYIRYAKDILGTYSHETVRIYAKSEDEYVHEYYLTFLSSADKFYDRVFIVAQIKMEQGLISNYVIDYNLDNVSTATQDVLVGSTQKHGMLLEQG